MAVISYHQFVKTAVHIDDFVDADDVDVLHRKELELNFNRMSENNIQLRKEKADLGKELGKRTAEKDAVEKELAKFKIEANKTEIELKGKLVSRGTFLKKILLPSNRARNLLLCLVHSYNSTQTGIVY